MSKPSLLTRKIGHPWIDYHQFILFDVESTHHRPTDLPEPQEGALAVCGAGGCIFFTQGDITDVVVELEFWSGEPATPAGAYAAQFEGFFTVETRRVVLGATTGSPNDIVVDLPIDGPLQLRAFRNSTATDHPDFPDLEHHDETWLLQVWPSQVTSLS
ncbi:hypothetical protein [Amycolatopsis japonica]|uniref:hypothetical protein n=1 Tax=Amycolatopsis japonica TaxID=208439 RepID=UPI0038164EA2